ncbi:hypothetical protein LAWI1_G008232, partial [Lachnellula willkommii]
RLVVFDQEFHVHSVVLKLYSAFFRKFLDSPDKATAAAAAAAGANHPSIASPQSIVSSKFKYEWVTKLDETISGEDADTNDALPWYLVAATGISKETIDISTFKGDKVPELRAFEKLLCAFYIKQYEIEDFDELETMTRQADYYCALPMLSRSLDGALWRSEWSLGR